jgi:hypothetical protein
MKRVWFGFPLAVDSACTGLDPFGATSPSNKDRLRSAVRVVGCIRLPTSVAVWPRGCVAFKAKWNLAFLEVVSCSSRDLEAGSKGRCHKKNGER